MKRKISLALLLALFLSFMSIAITSCDNGEKQVPVYRGMTIGSSPAKSAAINDGGNGVLLLSHNDETGDEAGNHYGQYVGDYVGRDEAIDAENPFSDSTSDALGDALKSAFNVMDPSFGFHEDPPPLDSLIDLSLLQSLRIYIYIDNPDNFEITSFTLNDTECSSDMYEKGSSMQIISINPTIVTHGNILSISFAFTIGDIKYLDGDEIKDVVIGGDTTVGLSDKDNRVVADVFDVNIGANALSFTANIDNNTKLKLTKEDIKAVLYDGEQIVASQDLRFEEDNAVSFGGLKANTLYQCLIVGYYDSRTDAVEKPSDTGAGKEIHILYRSAFYTDSAVLFDHITIEEGAISFAYLWDDEHQDKEITALKLYMGDSYVKDLDANVTSIDDLLPGTTYKLVAEYLNGDSTESIYLEFTTFAKAIKQI